MVVYQRQTSGRLLTGREHHRLMREQDNWRLIQAVCPTDDENLQKHSYGDDRKTRTFLARMLSRHIEERKSIVEERGYRKFPLESYWKGMNGATTDKTEDQLVGKERFAQKSPIICACAAVFTKTRLVATITKLRRLSVDLFSAFAIFTAQSPRNRFLANLKLFCAYSYENNAGQLILTDQL